LYERWKTLEGIVTKNLREYLRDALDNGLIERVKTKIVLEQTGTP
jgi:hypothetical protein